MTTTSIPPTYDASLIWPLVSDKFPFAVKDFAERRKQLRELATPLFGYLGSAPSDMIDAWFDQSPLVGTAANQINPRPSKSGLRDALPVEVLLWMIQAVMRDKEPREALMRIKDAIEYPEKYGVKTAPGSSAKTEYQFGVHKAMNFDYLNLGWQDKFSDKKPVKTAAEASEKISIDGLGIGKIIATIHHCAQEGYAEFNEITDGLKEVVNDPSKIDAIIKVMEDSGRTDGEDYEAGGVKFDPSLAKAVEKIFADEVSAKSAVADKIDLSAKPEELAVLKKMTDAFDLPDMQGLVERINTMSEELASRPTAKMPVVSGSAIKADGEIPKGKSKTVEVKKVFSNLRKGFDGLSLPMFDWDSDHPHVPEIDSDYSFDQSALRRLLRALLMNKPIYLHGHTGSGKTTLVEQVAARLNWPVHRLNLHGEITQMDLLGREVLRNNSGVTVSEYVEGPVPTAMKGPNILLLDEVDYIRANVSYALQRALEGKGLMLTEDGGRIITPHPLFRFVGTGNTQMKGDEYGMYREARIQSSAFINRWSNWVHVDYMGKAARRKLIKAKVPNFAENLIEKLVQYTQEHAKAFTSAEIIQPLSPRDYLETAEAQVCFVVMGLNENDALKEALQATIIDAAVPQDAQVLRGIVKNVFDIAI